VAHGDVVDVGHLERHVVEPGLLMAQAEEHVVVDVGVAAVAAIERADQVRLLARIDIVRADEAERLAEPSDGFVEFGRHQHPVGDPLHVRGALGQSHQFAGARDRLVAGIEPLPLGGDRRQRGDAVHHLDLIAVRLGEPHALAAARLVDAFHGRGAGRLGQAVEVVLARRVIGKADELRIAFLGDVDVVRCVGAAHVERGRRALGAHHAEAGEEFLHHVKIGRPEPPVSHIGDLDPSHGCFPGF
jgi:hypothetical protein